MVPALLIVAGLVFAYIASWTTYIDENENARKEKEI